MNIIKKPIFVIAIAVIAGLGISGYAFLGGANSRLLGAASIIGIQSNSDTASDDGAAKRMTLQEEVIAAGKVKSAKSVDLAFERGGKATYINTRVGSTVSAGQTLLALDSSELASDLKQAEATLESNKLALQKLQKPADSLAMLQAKDALSQAQEAKQKAEDDLKKAYEDGFNTIANAMLDLPGVMAGLEDMMFDNTIDPTSGGGDNITWYVNQTDYQTGDREKAIRYRDDVYTAYNNARKVYDKNFDDYKATSRTADQATIEALILQTYDTTKIIADTVKTVDNYIDFVQDGMEQHDWNIPPMVFTHQTNISSYTAKTNAHLLNLLAIKRTIENSRDALRNSERMIVEKQEYIQKLEEGTDALDIASQENRIKQAEAAVDKIKTQIAKTVLRAPFTGVVSKFDVSAGELVVPNMPVITLISNAKFEVESYISEADIAKVKVGSKSLVTLDTYGGGEEFGAKVVAVDPSETAVNGVNAYKVTLQFENEDERIKSGMTANVRIITAERENALAVPERAVITRGSDKFVLVDNGKSSPEERKIDIGIKGTSGYVEILSGLAEGEKIISFGNTEQK